MAIHPLKIQLSGIRTKAQYKAQGASAWKASLSLSDNPYYATSTAYEQWRKGWLDSQHEFASALADLARAVRLNQAGVK
jgi:hypothetical protein